MPAYVRLPLPAFIAVDPGTLLGQIQVSYSQDGFRTQFTKAITAWMTALPLLQTHLGLLTLTCPHASNWAVLLEFPLYRLQHRIDVVLLTEDVIVVIEMKIGETVFRAEDRRQVEEYALDLRDFHAGSRDRRILPVLWCTDATLSAPNYSPGDELVAPVHQVGATGLSEFLATIPVETGAQPIEAATWDNAPYRPVPGIIEAATTLFAKHDVRDIARADAGNLQQAASRIIEIIGEAKQNNYRALVFLTGVPGSGKTLAGLHVVHAAVATGTEHEGDIVYLSGNTPLVVVLREALAQDHHRRARNEGSKSQLHEARRTAKARVQHINDFLRDNIRPGCTDPPNEHAIVFDEAQRAWDAKQGEKKFNRSKSEPELILELMGRHPDWCACVCLIGGGQEINTGEQGVAGWGEALRGLPPGVLPQWRAYAPPDVFDGGPSTGTTSLSPPQSLQCYTEPTLQLLVPVRNFRSQRVSDWVTRVLDEDPRQACAIAREIGPYPIVLTRSLRVARCWLRQSSRGNRRHGLVASSGARRLRADGLGQVLHAKDRDEIAHWYLQPPRDIRSSFALEVPANEYTCQGLELDFVGLCWGGDLIYSAAKQNWVHRRLSGPCWQRIRDSAACRLLRNSYRVLLTRAREGMVIWVPEGDREDDTRSPKHLDETAAYLIQCGAHPLDEPK